ncbi:MAG TPA: Ig-like domain-containing protein [Gemmatimonadales bacterium]|nr:Ig-like domain-containing protein [Gemmatimonadales bacterium]
MSPSTLAPRRLLSLAAVALAAATITCVEHPTAPSDAPTVPTHVMPAVGATGIAHTMLTSGGSAVNQKVCTTASITPAANALVTVAVMGHGMNTAAPSPTVTGGGMSGWTQVATVTFDALNTPHKRLSIYRALSSSPGSGPIRITFTTTQANCQWSVSQWQGVETSGTNGSNAIVRAGSARGDNVTRLAVTLGAFADPADVAYGVFGVRRSATGITPGAGFTEIAERPSGETPPSDLQAERTINDNIVDATWSRANAGALAVEIRAGTAGAQPVATVTVSPNAASVAVGGTVQLAATMTDAGGEPLTGRAVTWTSDNAQVATVSSSGLVSAATVGSTTITGTSEGKSGTAQITVSAAPTPIATVEVAPGAPTVAAGSTVQLTATPKDVAGQPLSGRTVTWTTGAPGVATVSPTGRVTGVAPGLATITATSEGVQGTSSVTVTQQSPLAVSGEWSPLKPSPIVQLHLHMLSDGRVLSWGLQGAPQVWDPATGDFEAKPSPSLLFCSGHGFLPDGRLLVAGGHISNAHGLPNANIFDPLSGTWQAGEAMAKGRWYPTITTLASGELLVMSGQDEAGVVNTVPEIWNGSGWRQLTGASLSLPNYPRTFVAPDGRVFYAGSSQQSRWLDVTGTGKWTAGPSMNTGPRNYGSAVMYQPGKILYAGGGNTPTNTAEIIDLNSPTPRWTYTGAMAFPRWNTNATLLPTGDVLVTGGTSLPDRTIVSGAVNVAELWNPTTGEWTQLASAAPLLRGYHSTSVLLPDGRVLHTGGGDGGGLPNNLDYEVYSPPYLFKGHRPVIDQPTPDLVAYGQTIEVSTPDGPDIAKATLIRLGSVTHAFDQAQRLVPLSFSQTSGGLSVTLPGSASRTSAPPGPYMLFLVNENGVPSVGRIMRLQ